MLRASITEWASSPAAAKVRNWQKADMLNALTNVCFRGQSGHVLIRSLMSANDPFRKSLTRRTHVTE